ncbi:MAG: MFS transporter [Anaerolineaceae bacterium]|nr:MFS transporter [Anaerolineaceae bacterium]
MLTRLKTHLSHFLRIRPEDQVPQSVAREFKHNVIFNTLDVTFFVFADAFVNLSTIMTVFTATLTNSPFIIGLVPAILWTSWYLPQLFFSGIVSRQKMKLPFTLKMGVVERVPYMFMPVLALLIPHISKQMAITLLLGLMVWRGLGGGFSALPWQELMASVIPLSHRGRFWGVSRVFVQMAGVVGSLVATLVLGRFFYPYNYAIAFTIAIIAQWISFLMISKTREPEPENWQQPDPQQKALDFEKFRHILRTDKNFVLYMAARSISFVGATATSFLAVYGIRRFGLGDNQAAIFTGIIFFTGIFSYALLGGLTDRIGPKRILVLGFISLALSLVITLLAPSIWYFYLVFVLQGVYGAAVNMGDMMLVMELGEEKLRPTYLGLARTLTGIVLVFVSTTSGLVVEKLGYVFMFLLAAVSTLIAILLFWMVKDRPRVNLKRLKARMAEQAAQANTLPEAVTEAERLAALDAQAAENSQAR